MGYKSFIAILSIIILIPFTGLSQKVDSTYVFCKYVFNLDINRNGKVFLKDIEGLDSLKVNIYKVYSNNCRYYNHFGKYGDTISAEKCILRQFYISFPIGGYLWERRCSSGYIPNGVVRLILSRNPQNIFLYNIVVTDENGVDEDLTYSSIIRIYKADPDDTRAFRLNY